jgi:hypothetical protein
MLYFCCSCNKKQKKCIFTDFHVIGNKKNCENNGWTFLYNDNAIFFWYNTATAGCLKKFGVAAISEKQKEER